MSYKAQFLIHAGIFLTLCFIIWNNIKNLLKVNIVTYNENKTLILSDFILTQLILLAFFNNNFIGIYISFKNLNQEFVFNDFIKKCDQSCFSKFNVFFCKILDCYLLLHYISFNRFIFGCQTKYQCKNMFTSSILTILYIFIIGLVYSCYISKIIKNMLEKYLLYENVKIFTPTNPQECSICLETDSENFLELKCGHKFHHFCFNIYSKDKNQIKCPTCSQLINSNEIMNLMVV